jgi:23S rRNA-/tRNA-specific pseudouridylate synthase
MQKTMSHKTILTITEPAARLDRFLHQEYPSISKNRWREALTAGRVAIDDRRATKGSSLSRGQTVSFATELISELTAELRPAAEPNLEIVYQDENLLALNKPANCHTHPLAAAETGTLTNHLIAIFPELAGVGEFGPLQPGLLNRLDFATSGIVLAAFSMRRVSADRTAVEYGMSLSCRISRVAVTTISGISAAVLMLVVLSAANRERERESVEMNTTAVPVCLYMR